MRLALAALVLLAGCTAAPVEAPAVVAPAVGLAGTVLDDQGQPVVGAFVTAYDSATARSLSVRTGADGTYRLPVALAGPVTAWAHAIGLAEAAAVPAGPLPARLDLAVVRVADVTDQLPSSAYLGALPDGETKRRFVLDCGGCHPFNRVGGVAGPLVRPRAYWRAATARMVAFAGADSPFPIMAPGRDPDATADWLAQHLGTPGDAPPVLTPPPFDLPAERALVTEYALPNRGDLPHDVMPDAAGRIVVTGMQSGRMHTLDPATGAWAETPGFPGARALAIDGDGVWWVLLGTPRMIQRYDPRTAETERFEIGVYPHSIALGPDGRVWFNAHFSKDPETIGALDPATGAVETVEVPTPPQPDGGSTIPYGLRLGPGGVLWGTQLVGNRLIRYDPAAGAFDLFEMPTPFSGPRRPDVGPDGRVWIPLFAAGALAVFDPATETVTEHPLPVRDALPYIVRVDPATGVVWVATGAADAVLRFFPDEDRWAVHPLPSRAALVRHMELDADGAAWVAYANVPAVSPTVARIEILP